MAGTSKTISNAHLQQDEDGDYWLHVESDSGLAASLNLSALVADSDLTRRALEQWAAEQLQRGKASLDNGNGSH